MSTPDRTRLDIEAILTDLHVSNINASISLSCDRRIDVKLGDLLSGYDAQVQVSTLAEAAEWLRDKALMHYPRSEFSRKYDGFDQAHVNNGMCWSEMDLVDLGYMLTRELPITEIASHLFRSPAEVQAKIAELGRMCKDDRWLQHHRERRLASAER